MQQAKLEIREYFLKWWGFFVFGVLFYFLILIIHLCHLLMMLVAPPVFNMGHGACLTAGQDYCMLNVFGVFHCLSSCFFEKTSCCVSEAPQALTGAISI